MCVLKPPSSAAVGAVGTGCTAHRCSGRPQVSFSVHRSPARSRAAFRATSFGEVLLAPHSKRSSASDLVCEANTKHKVWIRRARFFLSACRISNCARTKCTGGNRRAGEQAVLGPTARGMGAAPLTHGQARHACRHRLQSSQVLRSGAPQVSFSLRHDIKAWRTLPLYHALTPDCLKISISLFRLLF